MVNYTKEIKKLLVKSHGPLFVLHWLVTPLDEYGGLTPSHLIDLGRGKEVLEKAKSLYKPKDSNNFGKDDP